MKHLQDIVKTLHAPHVEGNTAVEILDVTADSRAVKAGSLFIALDGATVDGHDYVNKAVEAGAVAVLVSKPVEISSDVCVITVEDTRTAMMACVPYFFDYPANSMRMIGVTGTNGKTTTTHMIRHILKAQGQIAKAGGRDQIELNFSRAAEMTKVSDKRLLEMYNALRPYRSSKQELLDIASELDGLGAPICANFVREAAENYERRKKLKGDN